MSTQIYVSVNLYLQIYEEFVKCIIGRQQIHNFFILTLDFC